MPQSPEQPKAILSQEETKDLSTRDQVDKLMNLIGESDGNLDQLEQYLNKNEVAENVLTAFHKRVKQEVEWGARKIKRMDRLLTLVQKERTDDDRTKIEESDVYPIKEYNIDNHKVTLREGLHRGTFEYTVDGKHSSIHLPADRFLIVSTDFFRNQEVPQFRWGKMSVKNKEIRVSPGFGNSSYVSVKQLENGDYDLAEKNGLGGEDIFSELDFRRNDEYSNPEDLAKQKVTSEEFSEFLWIAGKPTLTRTDRMALADLVLSEFPDEPKALNLKAWEIYEQAMSMPSFAKKAMLKVAKGLAEKLAKARGEKIKINEMDTVVRILQELDPAKARETFRKMSIDIWDNYPQKKKGCIDISQSDVDNIYKLMALFNIKDINDIFKG